MSQYNSVLEWIRSAAIPLATVEPRQGYRDLEPLRSIIARARIVSLGEATHGTREFFKLKHRMLEFCVAELGFSMFILEASFPESLAVNSYVLNGSGNAVDALAGMRFWTWDTQEVLDLIEWMRWWNQRNERKVKFYGYSMAYPAVAAQGLIEFLARVAPELATVCRTELAPLTSEAFAAMQQCALDGLGQIALATPFLLWRKADIVREGGRLGVPFAETWSCYKGGVRHCGRCGTCVERREAFHLAGIADPTAYDDPEYWHEARRAFLAKHPA